MLKSTRESLLIRDEKREKEVIFLYIGPNSASCTRGAFYRTTSEIKRDIAIVIDRIEEINSLLNSRELVAAAMESEGELVRYAEAAQELYRFSGDALEELRGLSESLDALKEEFVRTVRIMEN